LNSCFSFNRLKNDSVTNLHIRKQIKKSSLKNIELAETFNTSVATISKWRNRQELEDKSSRPCNIIYALNELEQGLAISIRKTTWLPLDEVWETLLFELKPGIFNQTPREFKNKILNLKQYNKSSFHKQR
jgi:hypothetical protein